MCLNLCLLSALLLGILYLFFGAFPLVFQHNHGFTLAQTGLSFLGLFIGMMGGILSDLYWSRNYTRLVRNREAAGGEPGGSEPEFRLPPTIFGAVMFVVGLFGFGWTTFAFVSQISITPIFYRVFFPAENDPKNVLLYKPEAHVRLANEWHELLGALDRY